MPNTPSDMPTGGSTPPRGKKVAPPVRPSGAAVPATEVVPAMPVPDHHDTKHVAPPGQVPGPSERVAPGPTAAKEKVGVEGPLAKAKPVVGKVDEAPGAVAGFAGFNPEPSDIEDVPAEFVDSAEAAGSSERLSKVPSKQRQYLKKG